MKERPLCLIKHHAIKVRGKVEVHPHAFLTSALNASVLENKDDII
jgi:hypothetical protein